jgi:hypothetical protein
LVTRAAARAPCASLLLSVSFWTTRGGAGQCHYPHTRRMLRISARLPVLQLSAVARAACRPHVRAAKAAGPLQPRKLRALPRASLCLLHSLRVCASSAARVAADEMQGGGQARAAEQLRKRVGSPDGGPAVKRRLVPRMPAAMAATAEVRLWGRPTPPTTRPPAPETERAQWAGAQRF